MTNTHDKTGNDSCENNKYSLLSTLLQNNSMHF